MKTVSLSSIVSEYRERKLQEEIATDWGSVVLPLDLDIFSPCSSSTKPWVSTAS